MTKKLTSLKENKDLKAIIFFSTLFCIITLIWYFYLNWDSSYLLTGGDGLSIFYPILKHLERVGGDWTKILYAPQILGGIEIHNSVGTLLLNMILIKLGLEVPTTIAFFNFFNQAALGYFIANIIFPSEIEIKKGSLFLKLVIALTFSFSPIVSKQIYTGSLQNFLGLFVFIVPWFLLSFTNKNKASNFDLIIATFALAQIFALNTYEMITSCLIFTFPVLSISTFSKFKKEKYILLTTFVVFFTAFMSTLPFSLPIFESFSSDDFFTNNSNSILSNYFNTINLSNWTSNLFQFPKDISKDFFSLDYKSHFHVPMGAIIIFLLFNFRKSLINRCLILTFLLVQILLTIKMPPFSHFLFNIFTPLKNVTNLSISFIPLAILILIVSYKNMIELINNENKMTSPYYLLFISGSVMLLSFLSPLITEIILWISCFLLLFLKILRFKFRIKYLTIGINFITLLFMISSLRAFKNESKPLIKTELITKSIERIKEDLRDSSKSNFDPLDRYIPGYSTKQLKSNEPFLLGLSGISGHFQPLSRFSLSQSLMQGKNYSPFKRHFDIHVKKTPNWPLLAKMYNIKAQLFWTEDLRSSRALKYDNQGRGWISNYIIKFQNIVDLLDYLVSIGNNQNHKNELIEALAVNTSDHFVKKNDHFLKTNFLCNNSYLENIKSSSMGQEFLIETKNIPSFCPITIATNFSSKFKAYSLPSKEERKVFPGNGFLLSVLAHKNDTQIVVKFSPYIPNWSIYLSLSIIIFFSIFLVLQNKIREYRGFRANN